MNTKTNLLLIRDKDVTADVSHCEYNPNTKQYDVTYNSGKTYQYLFASVLWLRDVEYWDPDYVEFQFEGEAFGNLKEIAVFKKDGEPEYIRFFTRRGVEKTYSASALTYTKSALADCTIAERFAYFQELAKHNDLESDHGRKFLEKQFKKMDFIQEDSALALYLAPEKKEIRTFEATAPIFPFGCNNSQLNAVMTALTNQVSIIEGGVGTGKTQTILNIVANLIMTGKSVLVVSNNNTASGNILEKLANPQYGLDFVVAPLGNGEHLDDFLRYQAKKYPDISTWSYKEKAKETLPTTIAGLLAQCKPFWEIQGQLAKLRVERNAVVLEGKHFSLFVQERAEALQLKVMGGGKKSEKTMQLWLDYMTLVGQKKPISFGFKAKAMLGYGISYGKFLKTQDCKLMALLQSSYYAKRQKELEQEIGKLEATLKNGNFFALEEQLAEASLQYIRGFLFEKYGGKEDRPRLVSDDLWLTPMNVIAEYPVVLSTAFTSRSSLGESMYYDYVIVEEASQVDITTGALALSCAKNVVVVGDNQSLPNVIPGDMAINTDALFFEYDLPLGYSFSKNNFLQSVSSILPNAPKTTLVEHYRCHPSIIGYCNQKFYDNGLLVMTEAKETEGVLSMFETTDGRHRRGNMNQSQVQLIEEDALDLLGTEGIGIISPYNEQISALKTRLYGTDITMGTAHNFQGQEINTVILSTVDDLVTPYTDSVALMNVSISRAKERLCLVTSGRGQPKGSNLRDLQAYINYENCHLKEDLLYPVFPYAYGEFSKKYMDMEQKRKNKDKEETWMTKVFSEILETLKENHTSLDFICQEPLWLRLRDLGRLTEEEVSFLEKPEAFIDFLLYDTIGKKPVIAILLEEEKDTEPTEATITRAQVLSHYPIVVIQATVGDTTFAEQLNKQLGMLVTRLTEEI